MKPLQFILGVCFMLLGGITFVFAEDFYVMFSSVTIVVIGMIAGLITYIGGICLLLYLDGIGSR